MMSAFQVMKMDVEGAHVRDFSNLKHFAAADRQQQAHL